MKKPYLIRGNDETPAKIVEAVFGECVKLARVATQLRIPEVLALFDADEAAERARVQASGRPLDLFGTARARKRARAKLLILSVAALARALREVSNDIASEGQKQNGTQQLSVDPEPEARAAPEGQARPDDPAPGTHGA